MKTRIAIAIAAALTANLSTAQQTLTSLGLPAAKQACAPSAFSHDGSFILGACREVSQSACSGRGCQPVRTTTIYNVSWNLSGQVLTSAACEVIRHHAPQPDVITYVNGYTSCLSPVWDTGVSIVINQVPYYYVTSNGIEELVTDQTTGYIVKL